MSSLKPGDVLSFSSGFQQRGPHGYRVLRREGPRGGMLASVARRWPRLVAPFVGRVPMVINAYPATIGRFDFGVTIDSYLSGSVISRALLLAKLENLPVIMMGQPLFVADSIFRHLDRKLDLPDTLLFGVGGYALPQSLESALLDACKEGGAQHAGLFQGYGVAEVDAGVMLGVERNAKGELVWYKRDDNVDVELDGYRLVLSLKDEAGNYIVERFATDDFARAEGEGFVVWNDENRLHQKVLSMLETWTAQDWRRRTGYINVGTVTRIQLRRNVVKESPQELDHWDYAKQFPFAWLWKPNWGKGPDLRATVATLKNPFKP